MRRLLLIALAVLVFASAAPAEDALRTYKARYSQKSQLSEREKVLVELSATGDAKALDALSWCLDVTRKEVALRLDDVERAQKALRPVLMERFEKEQKYLEQQKKQGRGDVKTRPRWHIDDEVDEAQKHVFLAERELAQWRGLLPQVKSAYSAAIASLSADDLADERASWARGPLTSRDWAERALQWELIGGVQLDWATDMLLDAAVAEADPRVLVHVLDGLAARDAARVTPALVAAFSDVRWLVRAAAVGALERTPSRDGVDALVALMESETGRLLDDASRALTTLTGEAFGTNGVQWRNWWKEQRETWTGPPAPAADADPDAVPDPDEAWKKPEIDAKAPGKTGFFGIDTQSRRRVYVIDVSGSMNERTGEVSRAESAKEELKRSIVALEDGALFNIVFFADDVRIWRKEMVEAGSDTRGAAVEYIDQVAVTGGTNTFDALLAAFDLGDVGRGKKRGEDPDGDAKVDTIILLSDGRPSAGALTDPDAIRRAIAELNHTRRINIHTVAFGKDADTKFLSGLAEDSGGTSVAK